MGGETVKTFNIGRSLNEDKEFEKALGLSRLLAYNHDTATEGEREGYDLYMAQENFDGFTLGPISFNNEMRAWVVFGGSAQN